MLHIALEIVAVVGAFVLGVMAASSTNPTVEKAVKAIDTAEAQAKATLDKITAHKAG